MAMYVNTNVAGLNGQRNLQNVTDRMNSSFEKLSSGSRINSARDDSAGLQIADRLTTQITGLNQGNRNANDGISIAQIAEGALGEITNNVQRMRQLVVQGGNRTLSSDDRSALGDEFNKLLDTNNDIANRTAYGTIKVLNYDSQEDGFQIQSGAQSGEQDTVTTGNAMLTSMFGNIVNSETITGGDMSALSNSNLDDYGTMGDIVGAYMILTNESDADVALAAMTTGTIGGTLSEMVNNSAYQIDTAELTKLLTDEVSAAQGQSVLITATAQVFTDFADTDVNSDTGFSDAQLNDIHAFATDTLMDAMSGMVTEIDKQRAKLGAEQNGLASTVRSNTASIVNVSDSRARIMDTDFASETAELTRNQIIQQAATTILSQANQQPNSALSLLR